MFASAFSRAASVARSGIIFSCAAAPTTRSMSSSSATSTTVSTLSRNYLRRRTTATATAKTTTTHPFTLVRKNTASPPSRTLRTYAARRRAAGEEQQGGGGGGGGGVARRGARGEQGLSISEKPWAALTQAEKVQEGAKTGGSVVVIGAGLGLAAMFGYAVLSELFFKEGAEEVVEKCMRRLTDEMQVSVYYYSFYFILFYFLGEGGRGAWPCCETHGRLERASARD